LEPAVIRRLTCLILAVALMGASIIWHLIAWWHPVGIWFDGQQAVGVCCSVLCGLGAAAAVSVSRPK